MSICEDTNWLLSGGNIVVFLLKILVLISNFYSLQLNEWHERQIQNIRMIGIWENYSVINLNDSSTEIVVSFMKLNRFYFKVLFLKEPHAQ